MVSSKPYVDEDVNTKYLSEHYRVKKCKNILFFAADSPKIGYDFDE